MSYVDQDEGNETSLLTKIVGVLSAVGGWALSHYFGFAALIPFLCGAIGLIGINLYSKNN